MQRSLAAFAAVIAAAVAIAAAPAHAARPAAPAELDAMLFELIHPELHRLPGCAVGTISTAAAGWGKVVVPRGPDCDGLGGLTSVVRASDDGSAWSLWYAGIAVGPRTACEAISVPGSVGRDLGVCTPAARARLLPCLSGARSVLRRRPGTCADESGSENENWKLTKIRWSRWGGAVAVGTATLPPRHRIGADDDGRRVHVRAFALSWSCGAAQPVYTRLRVWGAATRVRVTPYATGRPEWIPLPPFNTTHWLQLPSGCTYGAEELAE